MGQASISPDNDVLVHLAKVYSYSHARMSQGSPCEDGGMFPDGITNGYQWYPLEGQQEYRTNLETKTELNVAVLLKSFRRFKQIIKLGFCGSEHVNKRPSLGRLVTNRTSKGHLH